MKKLIKLLNLREDEDFNDFKDYALNGNSKLNNKQITK